MELHVISAVHWWTRWWSGHRFFLLYRKNSTPGVRSSGGGRQYIRSTCLFCCTARRCSCSSACFYQYCSSLPSSCLFGMKKCAFNCTDQIKEKNSSVSMFTNWDKLYWQGCENGVPWWSKLSMLNNGCCILDFTVFIKRRFSWKSLFFLSLSYQLWFLRYVPAVLTMLIMKKLMHLFSVQSAVLILGRRL